VSLGNYYMILLFPFRGWFPILLHYSLKLSEWLGSDLVWCLLPGLKILTSHYDRGYVRNICNKVDRYYKMLLDPHLRHLLDSSADWNVPSEAVISFSSSDTKFWICGGSFFNFRSLLSFLNILSMLIICLKFVTFHWVKKNWGFIRIFRWHIE